MPAKLLNLFQFCEFKIFSPVKGDIFIIRSADMNAVVSGMDMIDMGPEEKPAFGQAGDGNAGMMERQQFFGAEILLAI